MRLAYRMKVCGNEAGLPSEIHRVFHRLQLYITEFIRITINNVKKIEQRARTHVN